MQVIQRPSFSLWTAGSMVRVMPEGEPPQGAAAGASGLGVELDMARGERASFQVLLRPAAGVTLRQVSVETADLTHPDRRHRIAAAEVAWHQVGFVRVGEILHPHRRGARGLAPGWYPDPLLPVDAVEIGPRFTQPLWITLHTPAEAAPGRYRGQVLIRIGGEEPVPVQLALTVHDVALAPGAGHFRTSFDLLPGFLEQVYGKPLPREIARRYGAFVLEHRLNPDDFSRSDPPDLDDLRYFATLGMNSFCVINMARHRGPSIRGGLNSPPEWYTPEHWEALERRVEPFLRELKKEPALWKMAYVHGFDERDIDTHGQAMRLFFGNVRRRWGLPTLTTSHIPTDPAHLRDLQVDWLCPILAQYHLAYDFEKAERARAEGFKIWSYISLEPYAPYPNWRLDSPLLEARTLGWQMFHQNMDGFLYWGLNIWDRQHNDRPLPYRSGASSRADNKAGSGVSNKPNSGAGLPPANQNPFLDFSICTGGDHDWLYGDGVLLYPGVDGPIGSIRLANIRDGLQDHELLWMLGEKLGDREAARQACLPVTSGLDRFTTDPEVVARQRREILQRLGGAR